jgi:hypothetical protein
LRSYAKISPRFWTGESGRALRGKPNVQVVALYLMTAPGANMIGLFYLPLVLIVHETGLSETEVVGALDTLSRMDVAHYDRSQEIVWVPEMAKHQIAEQLKGKDRQSDGIAKELQPFVKHPFFVHFMKRYKDAFNLSDKGLPTPMEPPSKGVPAAEHAPPKPGTGTGTGTGGEPPPGSQSDPPRNDPPPKRSGPAILAAFGSRWERAEKKLFIKGRFDERDAVELAEKLNEIGDPDDRERAWSELAPAIDRYLRTKKPFYEGHPFATFIKDLSALRTSTDNVTGPQRDPVLDAAIARTGGRPYVPPEVANGSR